MSDWHVPADRCHYTWSEVAYKGAPSVLRHVRCGNRTLHESGYCHLHRDEDGKGQTGRWDRRVRA